MPQVFRLQRLRNNETACANDVKFIIIRVLDNGPIFYATLKIAERLTF